MIFSRNRERPGDYHDKITQAYLRKKAIVYLRQSTGRQVQRNTERQKLQYALLGRARELGFAEVEAIDVDLGCMDDQLVLGIKSNHVTVTYINQGNEEIIS